MDGFQLYQDYRIAKRGLCLTNKSPGVASTHLTDLNGRKAESTQSNPVVLNAGSLD